MKAMVGFTLAHSLFALSLLEWGVGLSDSFAQTTFYRRYGGSHNDLGTSVQQTTDGGYVIVGQTSSFGAGSIDVYLLKTNSSGDTLWTRAYGGNSVDAGFSVHQTSDGGYIMSGITESFGVGNYDIYVVKTNASGDTLWTRTYGGTQQDYGYSVQQTTDGGFVIAGQTNFDAYLLKANSSGDTLWTRRYGNTINFEEANSVQQTSDGGYIVAGSFRTPGFPYFGPGGVYVVKTDSSGDVIWIREYGYGWDTGSSVLHTSDGGYIIAGSTDSSSLGTGPSDAFLLKTNAQGDILWRRTYGGTSDDWGNSVQQSDNGGYIIAGSTESFGAGAKDVYLIKTNSSGDTLWTRTFGGTQDDACSSVGQTSDGGYIIAGWTYSLGSGDTSDVLLIKTRPDGVMLPVQYEREVVPTRFALLQNYPNPFNPSTTIQFSIVNTQYTILNVYDVLGREIATLVNEVKRPGTHMVEWNAQGLPSGVYFYRLQAGAFVQTRKLLLSR